MYEDSINLIRKVYESNKLIGLHEPIFNGNEKKYLIECIDSSFVSSVGKFVDTFEDNISNYVGTKYAVATSSGTSALHVALLVSNVGINDEVITQPLTFVATCNAIKYCGAQPVFVDVDKDTMGLSPSALKIFLEKNTVLKNNKCINITSGRHIKACIPMHTFGNPCRVDQIKQVCDDYSIILIEDSAESLGSKYKGQHTGTFGELGVFSFNGNKIITSGGGGCVVTNSETLALKIKHLTTTAKIPHKWEYVHDQVGYNYRMPNLNAALLVAQLEQIEDFLISKRNLAQIYCDFFDKSDIKFFRGLSDSLPNCWLNSIILKDAYQRDCFLEETNSNNIMTRPIWQLLTKNNIFSGAQTGNIKNSLWLADKVINIPSSVRI